MSAMWTIPFAYGFGYFITAVVLARHWYSTFDCRDFEGAAWGAFGALIWPVILPFLMISCAVKLVASRVA